MTVVSENAPAGAYLRPVVFEPTSNKYEGRRCRGFQIHVTDPDAYAPYRTSLALMQALIAQHTEHFQWRPPPYEYEHHRSPIDLLIGDRAVRRRIERLDRIQDVEDSWQPDLESFKKESSDFRMYGLPQGKRSV